MRRQRRHVNINVYRYAIERTEIGFLLSLHIVTFTRGKIERVKVRNNNDAERVRSWKAEIPFIIVKSLYLEGT